MRSRLAPLPGLPHRPQPTRGYAERMERVAQKTRSYADAARWDREQSWAMTPDERFAVLKELQRRVYGPNPLDVRASERLK